MARPCTTSPEPKRRKNKAVEERTVQSASVTHGQYVVENVVTHDEKVAEFLSFCIEVYKNMLSVSGSKVAEYFEEMGLLDFLLENYDVLHTLGRKQLLGEMERFLEKREGI